jgi:hypothetical protein
MPETNSSLKDTKTIPPKYSKRPARYSKTTSRSHYAVESNPQHQNRTSHFLIPIMFRDLHNCFALSYSCSLELKALALYISLTSINKISIESLQKKMYKIQTIQIIENIEKLTILKKVQIFSVDSLLIRGSINCNKSS